MEDVCEHGDENRAEWAGFGGYGPKWCGSNTIHNPHDNCNGIMCDHGCNAEEF